MTPEEAMASIVEITANLDAHIERRAQEIAAPRIAEVEAAASERIADLKDEIAISERRLFDLQREHGRQVRALERQLERAKGGSGA